MRLTLRTLLAYLDGNLEPDDSQDIGKKIQESEFATKLVHLIRDSTRRLRLGVPPLMGRGLAADPNSVAEYLEYRLPDERVPEFERICLESEIHLAEVASCHQILTLVLGEPAEIDLEMRTRLYGLAAHVDAPPLQGDAAQAAPAPASPAIPPAPPVRRPKPEVPAYLREKNRWNGWPIAALVLVAATLTFAGLWWAFGPAQLRQSVIGLVRAPQEEDAASPATDQAAPQDVDQPADAAEKVVPADETAPPTLPSNGADGAEPAVVAPEKPTGEDPDAPPAPEPPESDAPQPLKPAAATTTDLPAEPPGDKPLEPAPTTEPAPLPDEPPPGDNGPPATTEPAPAAASPESPARQPPEGFGRFTSKREVLLKLDPKSGNWLRLPATSPLDKGDRLLSLPAFRPTITLSSNITIQADGPALFQLEGWTDEGVPIIAVQYGRLLMLTVGRANNSLQLKIDRYEPLLTFIDAESTMAMEVHRDLPQGQDPETAPAPLTARVYATSGVIRLQEGDAAPVELQAPAQHSLIPTAAEEPAGADFPVWVTTEEPSDYDRLATGQVDDYVTSAKPAGLQFRELTDPDNKSGRHREVRALAIGSLMYLGDFQPCVTAMHEEIERFFWPAAMDELRAAVARSPETAAQVRTAFETDHPAEAGHALYRMLWGYSAADLKNGADRELVEGLNSDALEMRVMSFLTLVRLTGTGASHGYRPDDPEFKRRTGYNAWKQQIGKIGQHSGGSPTKGRSTKDR